MHTNTMKSSNCVVFNNSRTFRDCHTTMCEVNKNSWTCVYICVSGKKIRYFCLNFYQLIYFVKSLFWNKFLERKFFYATLCDGFEKTNCRGENERVVLVNLFFEKPNETCREICNNVLHVVAAEFQSKTRIVSARSSSVREHLHKFIIVFPKMLRSN